MTPEQVKCGVCQKQITVAEMEADIRLRDTNLLVIDGQLVHKACLPPEEREKFRTNYLERKMG